MSDIMLNKSTRQGVGVLISGLGIALIGKEADVVTLGANSHSPLDLRIVSIQRSKIDAGDLRWQQEHQTP